MYKLAQASTASSVSVAWRWTVSHLFKELIFNRFGPIFNATCVCVNAVAKSLDEAFFFCCLSGMYRQKLRHQYRIQVSIRDQSSRFSIVPVHVQYIS